MMMIDLPKVLFMLAIVHPNLASLSFSSSYSSSSSSQLPALHFDIPSKLHPHAPLDQYQKLLSTTHHIFTKQT